MAYVRINMFDFKSTEDFRKTADDMHRTLKSAYPEVRVFIGMEASETSLVGIVVYDDKEAADRAVEKRDKHTAGEGYKDNFSHEGNIIAFYAENEQIDNLVKSVS